jgi:primary-amine oxidase
MLTQSLAVALLAAAPALARPDASYWKRTISDTLGNACGIYDAAPTVKAPKVNPWAQITNEDTVAVWDLIHDPKSGFNLTDPAKAEASDNYVYFIDTLREFP